MENFTDKINDTFNNEPSQPIVQDESFSGNVCGNTVSKRNVRENQSLNNSKTEKAEKGFAGIIYCSGKLFGFADRQANTVNVNNSVEDDSDRKEVTKLFLNQHFVLAMTGTAGIDTIANGICTKVYLEDWVKDNIDKYTNPYDFYEIFLQYMCQNSIQDFPMIHLDAGYFSQMYGPIFFNANFDSQSTDAKIMKQNKANAWYSGSDDFVNYFKIHETDLYTANVEVLEDVLTNACKRLKKLDKYNSAGNTWDIFELQNNQIELNASHYRDSSFEITFKANRVHSIA